MTSIVSPAVRSNTIPIGILLIMHSTYHPPSDVVNTQMHDSSASICSLISNFALIPFEKCCPYEPAKRR
jgi:hypothetical protein